MSSPTPFQVLHSAGRARVCELDRIRPLVTPTYFPSVSGASKGSRPIDLIRLITESKYPRLLLSSYDLGRFSARQRAWASHEIARYRASGGHVFLDCGVFESYWLRDSAWNFREYAEITRTVESDFYAAFDGAVHHPSTEAATVGFSPSHVAKSIALRRDGQCALIAHGVSPIRLERAVAALVKLATTAYGSSSPLNVLMVAVPERECGTNVIERCRTIASIRRSLDLSTFPSILHILGCGHPIAMAAYCSAGADTFDSTDWCETAVDWRNFSMTDFALLDSTDCPCRVCDSFQVNPLQRSLLHNLMFYQTFTTRLQQMVRNNTLNDFLLETLGRRTKAGLSGVTKRPPRGR